MSIATVAPPVFCGTGAISRITISRVRSKRP
jgi:hypothetical protein